MSRKSIVSGLLRVGAFSRQSSQSSSPRPGGVMYEVRAFADGNADGIGMRDHDPLVSAVGGAQGRARAWAGILLTLPGVPYIYYEEEPGMKGMKLHKLRVPAFRTITLK